MKLEDIEFFVEGRSGGLGLEPNTEELKKLSAKDFYELYLGVMKKAFNDQVQGCKGSFDCADCSYKIENRKDFVRYYGLNLHSGCFLVQYGREREGLIRQKAEEDVEYFDLIRDGILRS